MFDIASDEGVARDVPAEAHRRFRADLAAKKEKNLRERAPQLALHEEKKRFIAEWIEKHGTPDQKELRPPTPAECRSRSVSRAR